MLMNHEYTPSHSPDSLNSEREHDLENPQLSLVNEQMDEFYENEMNTKLAEIKTDFLQNTPNEETIFSSKYLDSNSPLTMSCNNSDDENQNDRFKEITIDEMKDTLDKYFDDYDNQISNELDILITYMKGQKNLFIQSYLISQRKLNMLMIPSILITTAVTIFAPLFKEESWSVGIISGLNALTAMIISLINYLKLETSTQTFYNTATQYDKLETSLEFVASKLIFVESQKEKTNIIFDKFQEVETKIHEIKEWNSLFIPSDVRQIFPIICHINIFSFIKRIENSKKVLISRLRDIKTELKYINQRGNKKHNKTRIENRLNILLTQKDKITEELSHYRNAYTYIDELFTIEIKNAQNYSFWNYYIFRKKKEKCSYVNPVVNKFVHCFVE